MMRGSREKCAAAGTRGEARAGEAGEVTGACGGENREEVMAAIVQEGGKGAQGPMRACPERRRPNGGAAQGGA
jgi:hypothetical protein